jgi:intergrase/recombinase
MQVVKWSNEVVEFIDGRSPKQFYINIAAKGKTPVYTDYMDEIERQLKEAPRKLSLWKKLRRKWD